MGYLQVVVLVDHLRAGPRRAPSAGWHRATAAPGRLPTHNTGRGSGSPARPGCDDLPLAGYFFLLTSITSPKRSNLFAEGLNFASCSAWIG